MTNTSLPSPVDRFVAAVNRHDSAAFLSFFPADGVVDDWGRRFAGHDEIRGWSDEEFIGVDITLDVTSVEQRGDETVVNADVGGEGFNGPSTFVFLVKEDVIREMRITV